MESLQSNTDMQHPHYQIADLVLNHNHPVIVAGDVAAFGLTGAVIAGWLPTIASALSIFWFCVQFGMLIARVYKKYKRSHK